MASNWLSALKVVGIYLLVGSLWILFSDQLLELSVKDPELMSRLQTIKGWVYVLVTAGLLFALISRAIEAIENANRLDPLTLLLRHQLFRERLEDMLQQQVGSQAPLALIYLDIDDFKEINQQFGTDAADRLLERYSAALRERCSGATLLARISTDQFAIAQPNIHSPQEAEALAHELRQLLQRTALYLAPDISCSIGIAMAPADGKTSKPLLASASKALRLAKKTNRCGIVFFNHELSKFETERQQMLRDLQQAIEQGSLSLVYQPQFATKDLSLCGVEVLLRWQHPKQGFIGPDIFIPLAEENGLMPKVSAFVVERSYQELQPWLGKELTRISINVSALEFSNETLVEALLVRIQNKPDYLPYLQLEITETAAISNLGASIELVERLRKKGLRLSLDDFGTGFSSLAMLKDLPVNEVKIDRSFVYNLEQEPRTQAIVAALVSIANDFAIKIVAEGVETKEQRELLYKLGCHELQGYLLSPPKPLAQLWASIEDVSARHPRF